MHEAAPYGRAFFGDGEPSEEDNAAGELLMRRLRNLASVSNIRDLKITRDLPSGGTAIAVLAGGTARLLMFGPDAEPEEEEFDGIATMYIPMLFSGRIVNGLTVADPEGRQIEAAFTRMTRRRLVGYDEDRTAPGRATLRRFACDIPAHLRMFGAMSMLQINMTQYHQIRPTWWTGAMASVVQIVGGYGRQDFDALPRDNDLEQARFSLPPPIAQRVEDALINVRLPGYTGKPPEDGQFRFDMRFSRTDGVAFSGGGTPWLVRISAAGIYVMPLPLVPATTTPAFRQYIEDVGDTEIKWILDKFGGMPSGESFPPTTSGLEAWRRAGVIQRLGVPADFYDYEPFGSAMGWAFSDSGTEAFNTATGDENDLPIAVAYKARITVGDIADHGFASLQEEFTGHADEVNPYLSELISALEEPGSDRARAILYKLRRVPVQDILYRARSGGGGAADVDYWDNFEAPVLAPCEAQCTRISKGIIFPTVLPEAKIPEPAMEGCVSMAHDYIIQNYPEKYPACDTIVGGFYLGDDLKVVKYFRDDRDVPKEVESDFESCMTVGEWQETVYHDAPRIDGAIYTTDFDDRKEISEDYTVTNVKGIDLGFVGPNILLQGTIWSYVYLVRRRRYYGRTTNEKRYRNGRRRVYCYTPFMTRAGYVYGYKDTTPTVEEREETKRLFVHDPNVYDAWCYDWRTSYSGAGLDTSWTDRVRMPYDTSPPNPFLVERHRYVANDCADWADEGPWIDSLPADLSAYFHTREHWREEYGEYMFGLPSWTAQRPYFREYNIWMPDKPEEEHHNWFNMTGRVLKLSEKAVPHDRFDRKPDEFMNVMYQDCTIVRAGKARYLSLSDTGGDGRGRKVVGHTVMADGKSAHHFIGVIDE